MQPVQFALAILLGLVALAYVLYPLYRRPLLQEAPHGSPQLSEREQHARQALREVEFDYQLGNLDEQEYRSMRTRYMHRALNEMKGRKQREEELDAHIEEELRQLKEVETDGRA